MERRFIELVEYNIFNRGLIIDVTQYENKRRNYEAYASLFTFKDDVVDYVKNNTNKKTGKPSIEGYIGACSAKYLYIDIDCEGNMPLATKLMIELVEKLEVDYGIGYKSLMIYFSGNKGYHVGIPTKSFGADIITIDILPAVFKLMVKTLMSKVDGIDYSIYNTSRIFRCPFSQHPKSKKYKIPVSYEKIFKNGYEEVLEFADFATNHRDYELIITYSEKLNKLFEDCRIQCTNNVDVYSDEEGFDVSLSTLENRSLFRIPKSGERNDLIYKMAYRLFSINGLKVNEITDIMKFIYEATNNFSAKKNEGRYTEMEFKISMNSAYSRTRLKVVKNVQAKSLDSLAMAMFHKIKSAQYAKAIIPDISADLGGGWMLGNSYALIGKGGTLKSFLLQEELLQKAIDEQKYTLFMNLEMSDVTLYDRVWRAMFHKSMTEMIACGELTESNLVEITEKVKNIVGQYLHVFSGIDIEPDDVESIIKSKEDEIKQKISLVGIDSVGGMKLYNDNEAMTALKLSKGTKEAAKNTNTAIITINHARNDCPATTRDCSAFVRGGSKYIDNCDAYISLSSVVNTEESNLEKNPPDIIYQKGIKYLRFVNKRGSGNTINKIIKVDEVGRVIILPDSPSSYEVSINPFSF